MAAAKRRSKRPSDASSISRLPEDPIFLDEGLGSKVVAQALRAAGARVELHRDHFTAGTPDHVWLRDVGKRGWLVFSKDKRIRRRATEQHALTVGQVRAFVLTAGDLNGEEMADIYVKALPRIARLANSHSGPLIAAVSKSGEVKVL